jgi:hypothetical protein
VRWLALAAALLVGAPLCAQEKEAPREKKEAAKEKKAAPKKKVETGRKPRPSKEQMQRFNELEKKKKQQQQKQPKK